MQDLNDKINDGGATEDGRLSSSEWNQLPTEIQNVIESVGITLSGGDLQQLIKAIAQYATVGQYATGGGAVNAYTASVIPPAIAPPALKNGMIIRTIINNTNTGASTFNAFGLGVVDIKLKGGVTDPAAGDLTISEESVLTYRLAPTPHWELTSKTADAVVPATESAAGIAELSSSAEAIAGTDDERIITPLKLRSGLNAGGSAPIYACRAWVEFSGIGAIVINASGNISSVTDNGTGDYTINFTTSLEDIYYSISSINNRTDTSTISRVPTLRGDAPRTTSSCRFNIVVSGTTGSADSAAVHIQVIR